MKKTNAFRILIVLFFIYVLANVYASQTFNTLFFKLTAGQNRTDALTFLKKIKNEKDFPAQLTVLTRTYGSSLADGLEAEKDARRRQIAQLEALLKKNPSARDVLVKLAILYYEDDQPSRAKHYYQQAKTIDPEVKIDELEKTL